MPLLKLCLCSSLKCISTGMVSLALVQELAINHGSVGKAEGAALAPGLAACKALSKLDMKYNCVPAGLLAALASVTTLEALVLDYNPMDRAAAAALASALPELARLQVCMRSPRAGQRSCSVTGLLIGSLLGQRLHYTSTASPAFMLCLHRCTTLFGSLTAMSKSPCCHVAAFSELWIAVQSLYLSGCSLTDATAATIIDALVDCASLTTLFLRSNALGQRLDPLATPLARCPALQQVHVQRNIAHYSMLPKKDYAEQLGAALRRAAGGCALYVHKSDRTIHIVRDDADSRAHLLADDAENEVTCAAPKRRTRPVTAAARSPPRKSGPGEVRSSTEQTAKGAGADAGAATGQAAAPVSNGAAGEVGDLPVANARSRPASAAVR